MKTPGQMQQWSVWRLGRKRRLLPSWKRSLPASLHNSQSLTSPPPTPTYLSIAMTLLEAGCRSPEERCSPAIVGSLSTCWRVTKPFLAMKNGSCPGVPVK